MRIRYLIALSSAVICSTATAQSQFSSHAIKSSERTGIVATSELAGLASDPHFRAWKERSNAKPSYDYGMVLRFAECVSRFDRAAAPRVLRSSLHSARSGNDLERMSMMNRGCTVEYARIHPMLLRAALAETSLKAGTSGSDLALAGQNPVGLPTVVDGYRLRDIATCQVRSSPDLVRNLLATRPGDPAERAAADTLFALTAGCGTSTLGRLTPTAARLAIIEAEYMRRFIPGSASR